jgi:hypothetical protein
MRATRSERPGARFRDPVLGYAEAAEMLGITPKYLKRLADEKRVGYVARRYRYKFYERKKRLFPYSELLAYQVRRLGRVSALAYGEILNRGVMP